MPRLLLKSFSDPALTAAIGISSCLNLQDAGHAA